jgi:hypothetical protein
MPVADGLSFGKGRLDLSRYDKSPVLGRRERKRVAAVALYGESLHLRLDDPLRRLLIPLNDCLRLTGAHSSQCAFLTDIVGLMHRQQRAFWAWSEDH